MKNQTEWDKLDIAVQNLKQEIIKELRVHDLLNWLTKKLNPK